MANYGDGRGRKSHRNARTSINGSGRNGRPVKRGSYNSGLTAYERKGGRGNPYRQSNMIYRERPRRHWGVAAIAVLVIVCLVALVAFACQGGGGDDGRQQPAAQEQQPAAQEQQPAAQEQPADEAQQDGAASASDPSGGGRLDTEAEEGVTVETTPAGATSVTRTPENRLATSASANNRKPAEKTVYLTFDDGPSTNTHQILDILSRYGVHATWFVIESRGHLDYTPDIWNAGNQVALHSYTHEYDDDYKNDSAYLSGLDKLNDKLQEQLGFKSTLLRFPGGSVNDFNKNVRSSLKSQIKERQWHFFDWNVSSGDASANGVPAKKILANIKKESKGNNSCCVLMHDTEAKSTTVEALPQIIEYYISQGYAFDVLTADAFGYHF